MLCTERNFTFNFHCEPLRVTSMTIRRLDERFNASDVTKDSTRPELQRVTTHGRDRHSVTSHLRDKTYASDRDSKEYTRIFVCKKYLFVFSFQMVSFNSKTFFTLCSAYKSILNSTIIADLFQDDRHYCI